MSTLPSDTPRLPKWPFLIGDAALLGIAVLIAIRADTPYTSQVVLVIAGCVALATVLGVIPFLTDYASKQDEAFDERQRGLEALTRTLSGSSEQISIAANGLHELSALAQAQLKQAEGLPGKLQEHIHEFVRQLNDTLNSENDTLQQEINTLRDAEAEKLDSASDKIRKAIAELTKLESSVARQITAAKSAPASKPAPIETPAPLVSKVAPPAPVEPIKPAAPAVTAPASEISEKIESAAPTSTVEVTIETKAVVPQVDETPATPAPAKETSPIHKSKPREPKPSLPAESDELDLGSTEDDRSARPVASHETDFALEATDDERSTSAVTSDGATRLLVTAYIGIGNRLFVRGTGPGLNPDKGVPLQFVSIGKWKWETNDAEGAVRLRLFKNDETECHSLGEITLDNGRQIEVSAAF